MNWFRQIAEQNLKQNRASVTELVKMTRKMVDDFGNQASAICEHAMFLTEETLSNTFDCSFKLARVREPQELAQVHTDFVYRQAQTIADQTKELNERFVKGAEEMANAAAELARKQSKAA